jgi:hypothetical protein
MGMEKENAKICRAQPHGWNSMRLEVVLRGGTSVVIVSIVLPVVIDFALRSNTQRRVDVLGV